MAYGKYRLPGPLEPWMVKRGMTEEVVRQRLDEGSLWWKNSILGDGSGYYEEPGADVWPDLWYNDGKPGIDNWTRVQCRENWKRRHREAQRQADWGWLLTLLKVLYAAILLPLTCMGMGDAIHSMLGTGEYSGRREY